MSRECVNITVEACGDRGFIGQDGSLILIFFPISSFPLIVATL